MRTYGWSALLIATVAGCGEYEGPDGAGDPVEQVSSAIIFSGHDYLFFREQATWTGAKAIACPDAYRLARINSAAENEFIRLEAAHHAPGKWWIGYSDQATEGLWVWENGEAPGYINWATGQPANVVGNEDCAVLDTSTGTWSAAPCASGSFLTNFVCERNSLPTTVTSTFLYQASDTNNATRNYFQYAVNMTRNMRITVGTCGLISADGDGDPFLRLFSPAGAELSFNDDACGGVGSNLSYLVPATGTYYIHAGCYSDTACGGDPVVIKTECPGNCGP